MQELHVEWGTPNTGWHINILGGNFCTHRKCEEMGMGIYGLNGWGSELLFSGDIITILTLVFKGSTLSDHSMNTVFSPLKFLTCGQKQKGRDHSQSKAWFVDSSLTCQVAFIVITCIIALFLETVWSGSPPPCFGKILNFRSSQIASDAIWDRVCCLIPVTKQ